MLFRNGPAAVCLCLSSWSMAVSAQTPPNLPTNLPSPLTQDLIRDRQERLLDEQQQRLQELQQLPGKRAEPTAPPAPEDERCFAIEQIEISGASLLS